MRDLVLTRYRERGVDFMWIDHPSATPEDLGCPDEQGLVTELHQYWSPSRAPGHRYLAYDPGGAPIGKGFLSLAGPTDVASIFGMSVVPEARGRGVASAITTAMLNRAKEEGCARVVLHSSEAAVDLYRRAGFLERCELKVYATSTLWSQGR